jgi:hypothetical protein
MAPTYTKPALDSNGVFNSVSPDKHVSNMFKELSLKRKRALTPSTLNQDTTIDAPEGLLQTTSCETERELRAYINAIKQEITAVNTQLTTSMCVDAA